MTWHEFLDDDLRDLAALYVVGALEAEEARRFRMHLPTCDVCRLEADSLAATAAQLTHAAPEIALPPELWDRVLGRIRLASSARPSPRARPNQVWKQWITPHGVEPAGVDPAGVTHSSGAEARFEPTGIDGIEVRRLAADREKKQVTMLVRMAPGTSYPAHRHGGSEECFVLQGDIRVGAVHMHEGDFQRAEAGSLHPAQTTDTGCLLLIVSSTTDELLEP